MNYWHHSPPPHKFHTKSHLGNLIAKKSRSYSIFKFTTLMFELLKCSVFRFGEKKRPWHLITAVVALSLYEWLHEAPGAKNSLSFVRWLVTLRLPPQRFSVKFRSGDWCWVCSPPCTLWWTWLCVIVPLFCWKTSSWEFGNIVRAVGSRDFFQENL